MMLEAPINPNEHVLHDIKGDFIARLKKDKVVFDTVELIIGYDGGIRGFDAFLLSPSKGYIILECNIEDVL